MSANGATAVTATKGTGSPVDKTPTVAGSHATKEAKEKSSESGSDLERMMAELGLKEEDLDDVVYDDKQAPPKAASWIAVARVHIDKPYSQSWFFRNMRAAWDLAHDCKFRPLENNLYTVQFFCMGDWECVMEQGPWNFRGNAVVLVEYDGVTQPSMVALDMLSIWIQIHDVPDKYAHLVEPLAGKVGEVLFVETQSQDFMGNFYHAWVKINVFKPLKNAVSMIRDGKRQIYRVKYERLPDWCAVCGHLGHVFKEHGDGIHAPSTLFFKDLRASWSMRVGTGPGEGRGRRGGRRGGRTDGGRSRSNNTNPSQTAYD